MGETFLPGLPLSTENASEWDLALEASSGQQELIVPDLRIGGQLGKW